MATCETCGYSYDKSFKTAMAGESHILDSFECAMTSLAPKCAHCGCKILGHDVEAGGTPYCCAHYAGSARKIDVNGIQDRA